jgi:uncharacterized protein
MSDLDLLRGHLLGYGRVVLGYSGGVDSALLAVAGRQALGPDRFLAVIGRSASYPAVQWQTAIEVAHRFDVPLLEVDTGELSDPRYLANTPDRCYFCKSELWDRLLDVARARGFDTIVDGTNADDLGEHRPGLRAAGERQIRSPLAELGWGKARVREASRALGLPTWDAPAAPCLSSRVMYGLEITPERLRQVDEFEDGLRALGFTQLRVRFHDAIARLEIDSVDLARVVAPGVREEIVALGKRLGFAYVALDLAGFRSGSLNEVLPAETLVKLRRSS